MLGAALMTDREPWERWFGESRQAFAAFAQYRDMGAARSSTKVARALGKSTQLMERWSQRWSWVDRASAWDAKLDRDLREESERAVREMGRRQATDAASFQRAAMSPVIAFLERIRAKGGDLAALTGISDAELIRLVRPAARAYLDAARLERLARGLPEGSVEVDLHGEILIGIGSARDLLAARLDAMAGRLTPREEEDETPELESGDGGA